MKNNNGLGREEIFEFKKLCIWFWLLNKLLKKGVPK